MICELPNCRADVQAVFDTGLQELIAYRIHLARDHQIVRTTKDVLDMRHDQEIGGKLEALKEITIDTSDEANERYL